MVQSMDKGKCGGSYGGTEHWCILEAILLRSRTLIISSSLTSLCSTLLSGLSILFTAGSLVYTSKLFLLAFMLCHKRTYHSNNLYQFYFAAML